MTMDAYNLKALEAAATSIKVQADELSPLLEGALRNIRVPWARSVHEEIQAEFLVLAVRVANADGELEFSELSVLIHTLCDHIGYPWVDQETFEEITADVIDGSTFAWSQMNPATQPTSRISAALGLHDRQFGTALRAMYVEIATQVGEMIAKADRDISSTEAAEIRRFLQSE